MSAQEQTYWRLVIRQLAVLFLIPLGGLLGVIAGHHWTAVSLLLIGGAIVTAATLMPRCPLLGNITCALDSDEVLITIDDGPDPLTTPALLDQLDSQQAKALFFLIGDKVIANPHLVTAILQRGHHIANHSMSHPSGSFWSLGPWRMWRQINDCRQALATHCPDQTWFRPPVGHHNPFCFAAAQALGLPMMMWNCRGYDAADSSLDRIMHRLSDSLRPGSIILLHDARPVSIAVLEATLTLINVRGLTVAAVPCPLAGARGGESLMPSGRTSQS
jgi:peptidoglycan-N-acetylglucosamine deacetylase